MADVVVLNYNDYETTIEMVNSIKDFNSVRNIVIVDNASSNESVEKLKQIIGGNVFLEISASNGGYGAGNNIGINKLINTFHSAYILVANPDVIIDDETIEALESFLISHQDYVIAAPYMLDSNCSKTNNCAWNIPSAIEYALTMEMLYAKYINPCQIDNLKELDDYFVKVDAVAGSCFMVNSLLMKKYGMFDENIFLYCEEMTLALKFKNANLGIALLTKESFIHNHSVSINKSIPSETRKQKILIKSKLYVLKNYFGLNFIGMIIARIIAVVSIVETYLLTIFKRYYINE